MKERVREWGDVKVGRMGGGGGYKLERVTMKYECTLDKGKMSGV
jgi:hypothetical protein